MYQQISHQKLFLFTNQFFRILNSIQKWIAKEIIDFDPFDDEVIVAQELIEQFRQSK
jgi:hypothetical protein